MNPHRSRLPLLASAGFAIVLSLQALQLHRDSELSTRLDAIERAHKALQDSFLDGTRASRATLASSLGYHPVPAPSRRVDGSTGSDGDGPSPASPEKIFSDMQRAITAEPRNAAWAGNVQLNVRDVVKGLSQEGLPIPAAPTVDCRSKHCLISFDLGTGNDTDEWVQQFLTEIAGDLPGATTVQSPSPDGQGLELHIFATRR